MLKQRIITAVILVAIVMAALFSPQPIFWRALISLVVIIGFYEWLKFCQIEKGLLKVLSLGAFALCFYLMQMGYLSINFVVLAACILWVGLLIFTVTGTLDIIHQTWLKLPIGIIVLSTGGWLVIEFKELQNGALWILCFFLSVWAADIGAYFVGKKFGKTKLSPKVSPGKTVEGLLGGLALVLVIFTPILFINFSTKAASLLLLTILVTALVSVGGDLFESKLKRHVGLKDSSQILPGHGGILDRIDSLLSGAPIFAAGLLLLGYLV
ncbi:MAG: phosphatidate cytidylyltransferase [Paracoccaceae bacterium]|jgi:phosphatidate cytidylyltransferase